MNINSCKCGLEVRCPLCHYVISIFHIMVQDHIERGNIDLSQLKFRVLDEADEMLRMGFVEDVELILGLCF